jgi:hypothetical protein
VLRRQPIRPGARSRRPLVEGSIGPDNPQLL